MENNSISLMLEKLRSPVKDDRLSVVRELSKQEGLQVIDALIQCFSDRFWIVRKTAADVLAKKGSSGVPYLIESLKNNNEDVCYWASKCLGMLIKKEDAILLVELLKNSQDSTCVWIQKALAGAGERVDEVIRHEVVNTEILSMNAFYLIPVMGEWADNSDVNRVVRFLKSPIWSIRKVTVELLGKIGGKVSANYLIKCLNDPYWSVRKAVALSLSKFPEDYRTEFIGGLSSEMQENTDESKTLTLGERVLESLMNALSDSNQEVVISAIRTMGEIGNNKCVNILINLLQDKDEKIKITAVKALGQAKDIIAVSHLKSLYPISEQGLRQAIILSLSKIANESSLDFLLDLIKNSEASVEEKVTVLRTLLGKDIPRFVSIMPKLLRDEDESIRYWAVVALSYYDCSEFIEVLSEMIKTSDGILYHSLIVCIGKIANEEALKVLINNFREYDMKASQMIINFAGDVYSDVSVDFLIEIVKTGKRELLFFAVHSLGKLNSPAMVDPLLEILRNGSDEIKYWVLRVLSKTGDERISNDFIELLSHKYSDIRLSALRGLSETGSNVSVKKIKPLLEENTGEIVELAIEVLSKNKNDEAYDILLSLLNSNEPSIRFKAITGLKDYFQWPQDEFVLRKLLKDNYWPVRKSAGESLVKRADFIRKFLSEDDEDLLFWAVKSAGSIYDPETEELLKKLVDCNYSSVRVAALNCIAKYGKPQMESFIIDQLNHNDKEVVRVSVRGLENTNDKTILPQLKKLMYKADPILLLWIARASVNIFDEEIYSFLSKYQNNPQLMQVIKEMKC